jgi:transcriptional regulator with XRE-family HTH domain
MGISFKKIDAERKKIGMSITDFSKKVGISRKTYYDWENDVVPVLTKYLKPLEGVLGIDVKDIEDDKEKIPDAFIKSPEDQGNRR